MSEERVQVSVLMVSGFKVGVRFRVFVTNVEDPPLVLALGFVRVYGLGFGGSGLEGSAGLGFDRCSFTMRV